MRCALLFLFAVGMSAEVPDNLKPPDTEVALLKALGKGQQIYVCKENAWTLVGPEAELINEHGDKIGKHYAGPTWENVDGSKVVGQVQQRANAPQPNAIPWLLLKAASHEGSGAFTRVTYMQRIDTSGGVASSEGCDQSHEGAKVSADYQATYVFYVPRNE